MWTTSWIEVAGCATGALCVWLVVRRSIWNFPVGIANNVFFWILFTSSGLYADAWLQVVYVVLAGLGWYWWLHGGVDRTALTVSVTPLWGWLASATFVATGTAVIYWLLTSHTDSTVPLGDALTTALSLGAQLMLSRKWIGNWWLWIAADILYIALYLHKDLYLTALLYAGFLGLCVLGLHQWRRAMASPEPDPDAGKAPTQELAR